MSRRRTSRASTTLTVLAAMSVLVGCSRRVVVSPSEVAVRNDSDWHIVSMPTNATQMVSPIRQDLRPAPPAQ